MDPVTFLTLVGTITSVIDSVATQALTIKELYDLVKDADAHLMSLMSQLNTMKTAFEHIRDLVATADYDRQLAMDLDLAVQASQLHIDSINSKISGLKFKNAASSLRLRSKVRVVFESQSMSDCLERLNHQATALNLLITVLTSKSMSEQKRLLQRSNTRKVFKQLQDDKKSLLDEAASQRVLRDDVSCRAAVAKADSEPILNKAPWKRFSFDRQIFGTRVYGGKFTPTLGLAPREEKESVVESAVECHSREYGDNDDGDDGTTLAEEPERVDFEESEMFRGPGIDPNSTPQFTRMLAFAHEECNVSHLVAHARYLWNGPESRLSTPIDTSAVLRLKTRHFDLSIHAHAIGQQNITLDDDLFVRYKDVSSVLFAVNLSKYQTHFGEQYLAMDSDLFGRISNDYNLWLAKIIIFLNTTGFDAGSSHATESAAEEFKTSFLQAARAGVSGDRIHWVIGESDEIAAGRIFAICNDNKRVQTNKWAGLTRWATD